MTQFDVEFDKRVCRVLRAGGIERTPSEVSRNRARTLNRIREALMERGVCVPVGEVEMVHWLAGYVSREGDTTD